MVPKALTICGDNQEIIRNISGFEMAFFISKFSKTTYDYVDWHWHTEFQICIVTEGCMCFKVNDKQYIVEKGEVIFINSQKAHTTRPYNCYEAEYFCVDFHPNLICRDKSSDLYKTHILSAIGNDGLKAILISENKNVNYDIIKLLNSMRITFEEKYSGFELELVIGIIKLWQAIVLMLPKNDLNQKNANDNRFKEILLFIQKYYMEPLTLDIIASSINLSRSECCRYFKKMSGQTLFEYLTQYRINKSADLLLETDVRISEIAMNVGFSSQSYYTECFRKLKNMTPKEFRLNKRN